MNDYERLSNFEHKNERNLLVDKKLHISVILERISLHFPVIGFIIHQFRVLFLFSFYFYFYQFQTS